MCLPVVSTALECRAGWAALSLLCFSSQKLSVQIPSNCPLLLLESVHIEIWIDLIHSKLPVLLVHAIISVNVYLTSICLEAGRSIAAFIFCKSWYFESPSAVSNSLNSV